MDEKKLDYRNKWQKENQERIILMVKKGEKDAIRTRAAEQGKSLNAYISDLIEKDMQK